MCGGSTLFRLLQNHKSELLVTLGTWLFKALGRLTHGTGRLDRLLVW
jgi:hypothetical protein